MHENKEIWDKLGKLEKVMTTFLKMGVGGRNKMELVERNRKNVKYVQLRAKYYQRYRSNDHYS